ncbi:MAG TPA: hypothetical protein DEP45_06580 [Armatimonadetes bacterium]|nr:hypothetical protein [Armatimonadota bacterium]
MRRRGCSARPPSQSRSRARRSSTRRPSPCPWRRCDSPPHARPRSSRRSSSRRARPAASGTSPSRHRARRPAGPHR